MNKTPAFRELKAGVALLMNKHKAKGYMMVMEVYFGNGESKQCFIQRYTFSIQGGEM